MYYLNNEVLYDILFLKKIKGAVLWTKDTVPNVVIK